MTLPVEIRRALWFLLGIVLGTLLWLGLRWAALSARATTPPPVAAPTGAVVP